MDKTLQTYIDKLNALNFKDMYNGDFFLTWEKTDDELEAVFTVADALRYMREHNISTKIFESGLGISLFRDNSTRTRFSFASACNLLGLEVQDLDEGKSQIAHGETVRETANMVSFMASYEDDISQEMLIFFAQRLETYDPQKSDIKTFCRIVLEAGLMRARRKYATKTQQVISRAVQIETLVETESNSLVMDVSAGMRTQTNTYSDDPFFSLEKGEAFKEALESLSPKDQRIAQAIMDGIPIAEICNSNYCCRRYFYRHALPNMRRAFRENYF